MFEQMEKTATRVTLRGIHARAEITHPLARVWRYRVHPQGYIHGDDLPFKDSFAVPNPSAFPFEFLDGGREWTLSSGDSSFKIRFDGQVELNLNGQSVMRLEGVSGTLQPAEPVNLMSNTLTL